MILFTRPFLPPIEEYTALLNEIWLRQWVTNNGPLVQRLEAELATFLGVSRVLYTTNGTIALQIALKAMNITKEIITTPFSFVATTSSVVWEGCKPIFVDIDPLTLNIDPSKIEAAITPSTEAILATHCFGNPCDIEAIEKVAAKRKLKVLYDAAHCFGSVFKGKSVFDYGDVSIASFHATKVYHTIEGGAIFTKNENLLRRMAYMRNFGHDGPERFNGMGINGKNSEFHAAMGLCNLRYANEILEVRKRQCKIYDMHLANVNIKKPLCTEGSIPNSSYYPIILHDEDTALRVKNALESKEIFPRRYFYPTLSSLDYVPKSETPIANDVARRILCLPLFHSLKEEDQALIADIVKQAQN